MPAEKSAKVQTGVIASMEKIFRNKERKKKDSEETMVRILGQRLEAKSARDTRTHSEVPQYSLSQLPKPPKIEFENTITVGQQRR